MKTMHPEVSMEQMKEDLAMMFFGRSRNEMKCVSCGSEKINEGDFRDEQSRKEFAISHFCQRCQDDVFGEEGEN